MQQDALKLAAKGIAVFPLSPNSKIPKAKRDKFNPDEKAGVKLATNIPAEVEKLFADPYFRNCNLAIACGTISGIVGVDFDFNKVKSEEEMRALLADSESWPRTVTVRSKNGLHLYYRIPVGAELKGLTALTGGKGNTDCASLRGTGHYFVAPPSVVDGWEYGWEKDPGGNELSIFEMECAELPRWILELAAKEGNGALPATSSTTAVVPATTPVVPPVTDGKVSPGARHATFVRTATKMRTLGKEREEIFQRLIERNDRDFIVPKENAPKEIALVTDWVMANVQPRVLFDPKQARVEYGDYLLPLGYLGNTYYYTSSSNREIVELSASAHVQNSLLHLMPINFWTKNFPGEKKAAINWAAAASELMELCRLAGPYREDDVRGVGCWRDGEKFIYHCGDEIYYNQRSHELNEIESKHVYEMSSPVPKPDLRPLSVVECRLLTDAVAASNWKHKQSARLFAGALAILRLCGAMPWRSHVWLTGPKGCGKTTLLTDVANKIMGRGGVFAQGGTSAAGIRQTLKRASLPVIYDEAESNAKDGKKIEQVVVLARQSSANNGAKIMMGTPGHGAVAFRAASQFILGSIRVNLTEEADISRFAVLELNELGRGPEWNEKKKIALAAYLRITEEYGDRLFARMFRMLPTLFATLEQMESALGERFTAREGQQYGSLLAGAWCLENDRAATADEARAWASQLELASTRVEEQSDDHTECLDWLLDKPVRIETLGNEQRVPLRLILNEASRNEALSKQLMVYGVAAVGDSLFVRARNPETATLFRDSKWGNLYGQALRRVPGARCGPKRRVLGVQAVWIELPLAAAIGKWDEATGKMQ